MLSAILAISWLLFVILILAALSGWLINFIYAIKVIIGALLDVACQLWIDMSKFWRRKKERDISLDEYERHLS